VVRRAAAANLARLAKASGPDHIDFYLGLFRKFVEDGACSAGVTRIACCCASVCATDALHPQTAQTDLLATGSALHHRRMTHT
jgi:hypothetical protein